MIFFSLILAGQIHKAAFHKCAHFWAKRYYQLDYTHTSPHLYVHLSTGFKGTIARDFWNFFGMVKKIGPEPLLCLTFLRRSTDFVLSISAVYAKSSLIDFVYIFRMSVMHLFSHAFWQEKLLPTNQSDINYFFSSMQWPIV